MGLKSPSDGRLGWQRQDRVVTSPCTEKKKDALIRTFWHRSSPWGSALGRWDMDLDGLDATSASMDDF
jgi:hypothetical protein